MNVKMFSESQQIMIFQQLLAIVNVKIDSTIGHISGETSHLWCILNLNWLFFLRLCWVTSSPP